jgi:polysaccharide pyruvyl transferase WcaK-like protein
MTQKVLLYGYFGWHNAGDDLLGYGILKELSDENPSAAITVTSNSDYFFHYAKKLFPGLKIRTIPFRFLLLLREILGSNRFIIAGGTHFTDKDALNLARLKLFGFFYVVVLVAKLAGNPPVLLGHGIGPVTKPWNIFLLKRILKNSAIIIVRDGDSAELVRSLGYDKKCVLGFDCSIPLIETVKKDPPIPRKIIGLSVLPAYGIYAKKPASDTGIVLSLSASLQKMMTDSSTLHVRLFSFHGGKKDSDEPLVRELNALLENYSDRIQMIYYDGDMIDFLSKISECTIFIGMRYHSSLIAYLMGKPLIIIDYMGKCRSLAKDIGQKNEYILSLDEILLNTDGTILYARIQKLINDHATGQEKPATDEITIRQKTMFSVLKEYLA